MQTQVRAAMEGAFWNRVEEALLQQPPQPQPAVALLTELKQELADLVPARWQQTVEENIDTEQFGQV